MPDETPVIETPPGMAKATMGNTVPGGGADPFNIVTADRRHWFCYYEVSGDGVPTYKRWLAISHNTGPAYLFSLHPCCDWLAQSKGIDFRKYKKIKLTHTDRYRQPLDQPPEIYIRSGDDWNPQTNP